MKVFRRHKLLSIPYLLIYGACLCFFVDFSLNLIEVNHLKDYTKNDFSEVRGYTLLNYMIDYSRLKLVKFVITLMFSIMIYMSISKIWKFTKGNYFFTFVLLVTEFLFTTIPFQYIQYSVFLAKYKPGSEYTRSVFTQSFFTFVGEYIGECVLLLFLGCFASITHLQKNPDENQGQNEERLENLNNDDEVIPANTSRGLCDGMFWVFCFISLSSYVVLANVFAPSLLTLEQNAYIPIVNDNISGPSIRNLTNKVGFPISNVYISYSQRDTDSPNAYLVGVAEKKIFITETLMKVVDTPQLCAVVGHELGHYVHKDLITGMFVSIGLMLVTSLVIRYVTKKSLVDFGIPNEMPVAVILFVSSSLFKPLYSILLPFVNSLQRRFEYNADCFSAKLGYPIGEALTQLFKSVGQTFESAPVYSHYYDNHPLLSERIEGIKSCLAK